MTTTAKQLSPSCLPAEALSGASPVASVCPACQHHWAMPFYHGGAHPLTTVVLPTTQAQAFNQPKLPLDFVSCTGCGHVYNQQFDYTQVPYSDKPYRMFNKGSVWQQFLEELYTEFNARLACYPNPVLIEVGCGDGHFLAELGDRQPGATLIGFDPNGDVPDSIQFHTELFDPARHVAQYQPDMLMFRHVLEHLTHPLQLLQGIALQASLHNRPIQAYLEVPCIDRAMATGRTADFFYEHYSHFSQHSFKTLLQNAGATIHTLTKGYNNEVVYAFVSFEPTPAHTANIQQAVSFSAQAGTAKTAVCQQLDDLAHAGKTVAIWGGTGKAAAFIHRYGCDNDRFPIVVDSDTAKHGTFVPGTGQAIVSPQVLLDASPDVVVIPTQWRARDIVAEMTTMGIKPAQVLLEHGGQLCDYHEHDHPYK